MPFTQNSGYYISSSLNFSKEFSDLDLNILFNFQNWRLQPRWGKTFEFTWCKSQLEPEDLILHDNPKDLRMDLIYLRMANIWGENSYCQRMKVGCLVVNQKSIISDGYNGSPSGFPNECEDSENQTFAHVLHAEANAITKIAKSTQTSVGSTVYVTLSPCFECSKLIIQSGIKRVVFNKLYRNTDSIPFLLKGGVEILKLEL